MSDQSPEYKALAERYRLLSERFAKVMLISDGYQAELRETTLRMEKMARMDYLTELSNRRAMVDHLEMETARAQRQGTGFAVILFDIDNFKRINDEKGHDAGDQALVQTAQTLVSLLRRSDLCSRWGGEEFLVLCPETDLPEAAAVAQKCLEGVRNLRVQTRNGVVTMTLSGGVGVFRRPGEPWGALLNRADSALYRAKEAGKDRVFLEN